jgi:anhydro-N-acetylmuramic acid kinase
MNFVLGEAFGRAARTMGEMDLVGSHGQTVHHIDPASGGTPSTLQVGEASLIAEATGAVVVSDFRTRDMAAGGAGAPLIPHVDHLLFRQAGRVRALLNLGGIANVTILPEDREGVLAFDTGPGNMIIDAVTGILTDGEETVDRGGRIARGGAVDDHLLRDLLDHPFLHRPPPKSTGREVFGRAFVDDILRRREPDADLLRTVTELTAASVADAIRRYEVDEVIASGGGTHNETLMTSLRRRLDPIPLRRLEEVSEIPGDAKEAVAFAVLANEAIHGHPANVPAATGARGPVILGKITV